MATKNDLLKAFMFIRKDSGAKILHYVIDDHSYVCGTGIYPLQNMVQHLIPKRGDVEVCIYGDGMYEIRNESTNVLIVVEDGSVLDSEMEELMDDDESAFYDIEYAFNDKKPIRCVKIPQSMRGYNVKKKGDNYISKLEHAYKRML